MDQHAAQAILNREGLQQLLALTGLNVEVPGDEIRERARVTDALEHLLDDLRRKPRLLAQLARALADFAMQRDERGVFLIERREVRRFTDRSLEIAIGLGVVHRGAPSFALQDQLDPAQIALDLANARDRPRGVQHSRGDLIDVFLLGNSEDFAVGLLESGFYGTQCRRPARADRRRDAGKQHSIA